MAPSKPKNNWHRQSQKTSRILLASDFVTWTAQYIQIISQLTLTFIRIPTCQAYKCTNTTGRTTKGKSFFKVPAPKNATERKWVQQRLRNMGMGQDFTIILICNQEKKDLVAGDIPTIFPNQIFDQIKMDGTKVLLTRHVLERRNTSVKLIVFKKATAINIWWISARKSLIYHEFMEDRVKLK